MASLLVSEESTITNVEYLDRGYDDYIGKLNALGADISRVSGGKKEKCKAALHSALAKAAVDNTPATP